MKNDFNTFKETAEQRFGKADAKTLAFRNQHQALGYSVVFSNGIPDETILDILKTLPQNN